MKTKLGILLALLCLAVAPSQALAQDSIVPDNIPGIRIRNPETGKFILLRLAQLSIDVQVIGRFATTTFDMTFHNDYASQLEGELVFPLGEGASVSAFVMEMNGNLRQGVVVEKNKGQQVFENIIRRRIDPALLEWTPGNNFRARVFPIPAKGDKRVVISCEQELTPGKNGLAYHMPTDFGMGMERCWLKLTINGQPRAPVTDPAWKCALTRQENTYILTSGIFNLKPPSTLDFQLPGTGLSRECLIDQGKTDTLNYFYVTTRLSTDLRPREMPASLCVYWDVSSSGAKRNIETEVALLLAYIDKAEQMRVKVVTFSSEVHDERVFEIRNCNTSALKEYLCQLIYDGGTQLGAIDMRRQTCEQIMLFTDGVSNFGEHEIILSSVPVTVINSATTAEHAYLNYIAQRSGGSYLNLLSLSPDEALSKLSQEPYRCIAVEYDSTAFSDIYPQAPFICTGNPAFAGRMLKRSGTLKFHFGYGNNISYTETYEMNADTAASTGMIES